MPEIFAAKLSKSSNLYKEAFLVFFIGILVYLFYFTNTFRFNMILTIAVLLVWTIIFYSVGMQVFCFVVITKNSIISPPYIFTSWSYFVGKKRALQNVEISKLYKNFVGDLYSERRVRLFKLNKSNISHVELVVRDNKKIVRIHCKKQLEVYKDTKFFFDASCLNTSDPQIKYIDLEVHNSEKLIQSVNRKIS